MLSNILGETQRLSLRHISTKQSQALLYKLKSFSERSSRLKNNQISQRPQRPQTRQTPQSSKSILSILKNFDFDLFDSEYQTKLIPCGESKSYPGKYVHLANIPVTQGMYCDVTGEPRTIFKEFMSKQNPAYGVSFLDAIEFCNLLSARMGFDKCYDILKLPFPKDDDNIKVRMYPDRYEAVFVMLNRSAEGFRLPTVDEWGQGFFDEDVVSEIRQNSGKLPLAYLEKHGWVALNSKEVMHNVAQKEANSLGFYDMLGNVFQYVQKVHVDYESLDDMNTEDNISSFEDIYSEALSAYFAQKKNSELVADSEPYFTYPVALGGDFLSMSGEIEVSFSESAQLGDFCLFNSSIFKKYADLPDSPQGYGIEYYSNRFGGDLELLNEKEKGLIISAMLTERSDIKDGPRFSKNYLAYIGFRLVLAFNK